MTEAETTELKKCRVCENEQLLEILSLGNQLIVNFADSGNTEGISAPLNLVLCPKCGLLQLKYTVARDLMYRKYWYKSSMSVLMRKYLNDVVKSATNFISLNPEDIVLDIGANDGTLLQQYLSPDLVRVGFEPSDLYRYNTDSSIVMINDYFNHDEYSRNFGSKKAKIITCIAMFYDLDDPNVFVRDITMCLQEDGLWIIQMNYLGSMLDGNTFDNISHEHLEYYSLHTLQYLLNLHGLEIVKAELNEVNGGSIRAYVMFKDRKNTVHAADYDSVSSILENEKEKGLMSLQTYILFMDRINEIGRKLINFMKNEKQHGKKFCIYGASTRGFVILQYFKIGSYLIDYAVDKNSEKWGKSIIGTGIKIFGPNKIYDSNPDYLFLLPYHLAEEIRGQESRYLDNGGKILVPIPEPALISSSGKEKIK